MRKLFLIFIVACLFIPVYANPITITLLTSGDTKLGDTTLFTEATKLTKADFPNTEFVFNKIDLSDGSSLSMDAQLAAGTPPNVYLDTMVRASKYMVPEYALPLNTYIRDLDKYNKGVLDPYKRNGQLLALPSPGGAQAMCINLDIMKEIGYTVPNNWTINDFMKMAELVKEKYHGKKWATGMFAANQSGDYLINNWFESFGAYYYANGDYDRSVIANTGGDKAYKFFQGLVTKGYVPPNSETLTDDDYAAEWYRGQLAATAFFPNWTEGYFKTAESEGLKRFNYAFVPFPRDSSVKVVPTYFSNAAVIVHKTGTEADKVAARWAEYYNSAYLQSLQAKIVDVIPNRVDAIPSNNVFVAQVSKIVSENGIYDAGLTDPRFTERRSLNYPILQKVLTFKMTPENAIKEYQKVLSNVN